MLKKLIDVYEENYFSLKITFKPESLFFLSAYKMFFALLLLKTKESGSKLKIRVDRNKGRLSDLLTIQRYILFKILFQIKC